MPPPTLNSEEPEKARERWLLDYPLPVTWVFIGWSTDGRAWA